MSDVLMLARLNQPILIQTFTASLFMLAILVCQTDIVHISSGIGMMPTLCSDMLLQLKMSHTHTCWLGSVANRPQLAAFKCKMHSSIGINQTDSPSSMLPRNV